LEHICNIRNILHIAVRNRYATQVPWGYESNCDILSNLIVCGGLFV